MFRIIVEEVTDLNTLAGQTDAIVVERYRQTVEALDLQKVIAAANYKPRAPRVRKAKAA